MFKNLKLGSKMGLGFGLVIVIAMALGVMAVFSMNNAAQQSTMLATEYVPEVQVATEIRDTANRMMYAMRGYGLSEDEAYLKDARKEQALMDKALLKGDELAGKAQNLKKLAGELAKIREAEKAYSAAVEETAQTIGELARHREELDKNAAAYMAGSDDFLGDQNAAMKKDLDARQKKIALVTDLVDLGSNVRVLNYKSQALLDPTLMEQAMTELRGVGEITTQLGELSKQPDDLKRIDNIAMAAEGYRQAMKGFLEEFQKGVGASQEILKAQREAMDKNAAIYTKSCDDYLHGQQAKLTADMEERNKKITLANDVTDLGNDARIKTFKSQALRDPEIIRDGQKNFPKIAAKLDELQKLTKTKVNLDQIEAIRSSANGYRDAMAGFLASWLKLQDLGKLRDKNGKDMIDACDELDRAGMGNALSLADQSMSALNTASLTMLIGLAVALVIGVLLAWFITRSITKPINVVISGLNQGSEQVTAAASEVSTASQSLAQGASQQAASLEETSSSLEEMASMTRQNAENAEQADGMMKEASRVVAQANQSMTELKQAMDKITSASDETAKIIKTIDEIAFQTNLLALNAAVEAARAGEAGAGFAVVADEVRNLAMRAAEAAKNTSALIEENLKDIKNGSQLMTSTDEAFGQVEENSRKVGELVGEIAAASQEQAQGIEQVNRAMGEMDKVTQQNAANAEESAAAAEELSAQAETMEGFVGDLVALVGNKHAQGNDGSRKLKTAAPRPKALPQPHAYHEENHKAKKAPISHREEQLPLDDEDFKDF